jgi:hypothetical protein
MCTIAAIPFIKQNKKARKEGIDTTQGEVPFHTHIRVESINILK